MNLPTGRRARRVMVAVLAILLVAVSAIGCADAGDQVEASEQVADAAPTLVEIMQQLETDMERVAHGVWIAEFDSIVAGGQAIADHPQVGPDERTEIMDILGERGAGFREADMAVHNTALELTERAHAEDLPGVLETLSRLQEQCVACHVAYRSTLQTARQ